MKKNILKLALFLAIGMAFLSCKEEKKNEQKEEIEVVKADDEKKIAYQCPMKCEEEKTYEKEGTCPVCKMKLRKLKNETNEDHDE